MIGHIRRASTDDTDAIIRVHRTSVTELCAKDYNAEQIAAWTGKHSTDAGKQRWADKIQNDFVWVLELDCEVCAFDSRPSSRQSSLSPPNHPGMSVA